MTQQPFPPSALRGAVDLSALKRPPAGAGRAGAGPAGGPGGVGAPGSAPGADGAGAPAATGGLVVEGSDATFQDFVNSSVRYPVVVVLWSARLAESGEFVKVMSGIARANEGRFQLVSVDVDQNPGLLRALQVQQVPMTLALLQGRPVPLFMGSALPQEIQPLIDELLTLAVQNGVTGRVDVSGAGAPAGDAAEPSPAEDDEEEPIPAHLVAAYEAIEKGDLASAAALYETALIENPDDAEAKLALGQVRLMMRTDGADVQAARAAAAADPTDVSAQTLAADLDILDGRVEEAFSRLVDTVRATEGGARNQARQHLLELFELVGPSDERVTKARRALMTALF